MTAPCPDCHGVGSVSCCDLAGSIDTGANPNLTVHHGRVRMAPIRAQTVAASDGGGALRRGHAGFNTAAEPGGGGEQGDD
jgi:hypothetical protein